jgi:hypothetical protein
VASDPGGRIAIAVPSGWEAVASEWSDPLGPAGTRGPALVVSPAPGRWLSDTHVPGAFIGLSDVGTTPAAYVAEHPRVRCTAAPTRTIRGVGVDWTVAEYVACPGSKPTIVEAAGRSAGSGGLVYAQIMPPAGSGPEFVDALVAGIRVRAT